MMTCLCFLFHPPIALTRSTDSASMFGELGDKDRAHLGLSHTDLEELMEVSADPSHEDSQPSETATKEENFLDEYVRRFR